MTTENDWRELAACKGENPNVFFENEFIDLALTYCRTCLVQPECLRDAMIRKEYGVRGNTTYEERKKLRKFPNRIDDVKVIVEFIE